MKKRSIGLFILSVIIGFSIVTLARATDGQQLYVSAKTITDYETTIQSEKEDTERIRMLVEETETKLKEVQELAGSPANDELKNRMLEELNYYKTISGTTNIHGEGVIVHIDDGTRELYEGEDPNNVLVHDIDILNIINDLNRSGAEVLSVNGQRLSNTTSISCAGYTIRINDQFFARPFEIRAIGDSKRMAAALVGPEGYGTLLKEYGVIFKLTISDDLTISKYPDDLTYQYMTKEKEGE